MKYPVISTMLTMFFLYWLCGVLPCTVHTIDVCVLNEADVTVTVEKDRRYKWQWANQKA